MAQSQKLLIPPTTPVVTVDEAKEHERIFIPNDIANDTLIQNQIEAATRMAEEFTRRAFITQTWVFETTCISPIIEIPRPNLQRIIPNSEMVTTGPKSMTFTNYNNQVYDIEDDTWFENDVYQPGQLIFKSNSAYPFSFGIWGLGYAWGGFLTLQFEAGYGDTADDVPWEIKEGILQIFGHLYENREGQPLYPGSFAFELLRPFKIEYI